MVAIKQRIVPHLWYDKEAKDAAEFYTSIFPDSKITNITTLHDTPSGDCDVVDFELAGQPFMAISAGPLFKFNESISFIVRLAEGQVRPLLADRSCTNGRNDAARHRGPDRAPHPSLPADEEARY